MRRTKSQPLDAFLTDQVCLVTGGAQGIGWALAQALADHGAQVFLCDTSLEHLARAANELKNMPCPERITMALCDVTDRAAVDSWIADVFSRTGRIDVLVNNAAFIRWETVQEMTIEDAERTMRVGYDGMLYTIKAVLPLMQAANRGHIVNIGSSVGRLFVAGPSAAYSAAKAAIDGYTQILQIELQQSPITVTLVRPYAVAGTDFFGTHVPSSKMPRLADIVPYLTPPHVAMAIIHAIHNRRLVVDIPNWLRVAYLAFAVAPRFVRWLATVGGQGQRQYGKVDWQYRFRK